MHHPITMTNVLLHQALYRLFAWLFLYPDEERLNTLKTGAAELLENDSVWREQPYGEALRPMLVRVASLDMQGQEEFIREHNRLFDIRPIAPPYESIYTAPSTEGRGWVSTQLERLYGRFGLAMSSLNELPDHLAVELEFLSYLCEREAEALADDDHQKAAEFQQAQQDFLDKHLRKWLGILRRKVQTAAPYGYYADTVDALIAFIG